MGIQKSNVKTIVRIVGAVAVSMAALCLIALFCQADSFTHGYYCDDEEIFDSYTSLDGVDDGEESASSARSLRSLSLSDEGYSMEVDPESGRLLKGIQLFVLNTPRPTGSEGRLTVTVYDESGTLLESSSIDEQQLVREVYYRDETHRPSVDPVGRWFRFVFPRFIDGGRTYRLSIEATGFDVSPSLAVIDSSTEAMLPSESRGSELMVGFGYTETTFSGTERLLIIMLVCIAWFALCSLIIQGRSRSGRTTSMVSVLLLVFLMTMNFSTSVLNPENTGFGGFQEDSELLVTDSIQAVKDGYWFEGENARYNLGHHADANGPNPEGAFVANTSLFGLQGIVFTFLGRFLPVWVLNFGCCLALSVVLIVFCCLIYKKYNLLMAGCFYGVFLLSPLVINFARNLYWVEFTWFVPILFGLICSLRSDNNHVRIVCYLAVFASVCIKCLCGYEFISSIIMAIVAFVVADAISAIVRHDKGAAAQSLKSFFALGVASVVGFAVALLFHGWLRGAGDVLSGLSDIFEQDVSRRTVGSNLDYFESGYFESINASVWETLCRCFAFREQVVSGLPGSIFPLLVLTPLVLFAFDLKRKRLDVCSATLYATFFLGAVSWFVLAKSHSYVHWTLNEVVWYLGFVQMCLYIPLRGVRRFVRRAAVSGNNDDG